MGTAAGGKDDESRDTEQMQLWLMGHSKSTKRKPTVQRDNKPHKERIIVWGDVINSPSLHGLYGWFYWGRLL